AHIRPVADEEDLVEIDDVADLGVQALDAQLVAGAHAVPFTACTKNRIHWESSSALEAVPDRRKRRMLVSAPRAVNAAVLGGGFRRRRPERRPPEPGARAADLRCSLRSRRWGVRRGEPGAACQ